LEDAKETSVTTYKQLVDQIEALKKQAEQVRKAELAQAIQEIRDKMAAYGITLADLRGGRGKGKRSAVAPKYRNNKTGDTWSGRGKPPRWLVEAEKGGASRERFLIKG
jgi:DNA-binding protein H-NS